MVILEDQNWWTAYICENIAVILKQMKCPVKALLWVEDGILLKIWHISISEVPENFQDCVKLPGYTGSEVGGMRVGSPATWEMAYLDPRRLPF